MTTKTPKTPPQIVTLHLVSVSKFNSRSRPLPEVLFRTFEYMKGPKSWTVTETDKNKDDAPFGLRRIKALPAIGGVLGTCAAAETKEAALQFLLKTLKAEKVRAEDTLEGLVCAIEAVERKR